MKLNGRQAEPIFAEFSELPSRRLKRTMMKLLRFLPLHRSICILLTGLVSVMWSCSVQIPELKFSGHESVFEREVLGDYRMLPAEFSLFSLIAADRHPPEVQTLSPLLEVLENQQNHLPQIEALLQRGLLGIDNRGFLVLRNQQTLPPARRQQLRQLVTSENRNRQAILKSLRTGQPTDSTATAQLQQRWLQWLQEQAPRGSWIQAEDGSWHRK